MAIAGAGIDHRDAPVGAAQTDHTNHRAASGSDTHIDRQPLGQRLVELGREGARALLGHRKLHRDDRRHLRAYQGRRQRAKHIGGQLAALTGIEHDQPHTATVQQDLQLAGADPVGIVDSLILDLLEWIGPNARPYAEVMEAWRTSCPRLPVWEEATERGFIVRHFAPGRETVAATALGAEYVRTHRPVGVAV
jgi:hypothetical protein